jgi:hypothetical protein
MALHIAYVATGLGILFAVTANYAAKGKGIYLRAIKFKLGRKRS